MKPEERELFTTFMRLFPKFLDAKSWDQGPDPPDLIITDIHDRQLGVELTEWLDKDLTTLSIADQENEAKWLNALDSEHHAPPTNFRYVTVEFQSGARFSKAEASAFIAEFYQLVSQVDRDWGREMANTPQKIWTDFSQHPTLRKRLLLIHFYDRSPIPVTRWVIGTPNGGAFDKRGMTRALLERIEDKKNKSNYPKLKQEYGLSELVLFLHYGIRGLLHNPPFDGGGWRIEDVVAEARANLAANPGPFDKVFLYLAYNEAHLFTLYP